METGGDFVTIGMAGIGTPGRRPERAEEKRIKSMKLLIRIIEQADKRYRAWCPALPGCVVYAQSRDQAIPMILEAVEGYLANLDMPVPAEMSKAIIVEPDPHEVGRLNAVAG